MKSKYFAILKSHLKTPLLFCAFVGLLTGIVYPFFITLCAKIMFPEQSNGSLIIQGNQVIGSALIGQEFTSDKYFWGRPSATTPYAYNSLNSSGSNMGPANPAYLDQIRTRVNYLRAGDPNGNLNVPVDLYTTSGSGLDPDITIPAALYQVPRISAARKIDQKIINEAIYAMVTKDILSTQETMRVNVLKLNLFLDSMKSIKEQS